MLPELDEALGSLDEAEASRIKAQQLSQWRKERSAKRDARKADIAKFAQAKKPTLEGVS